MVGTKFIMEAITDVGQIINEVKERNRFYLALEKIELITSAEFDPNTAEQDRILIADLCKQTLGNCSKIRAEVSRAVSILETR